MQIRALGAAWVVWASMAAVALGQATRQADFEEQFALAADRRALLAQLIPGSEDAYYYSALERQQAGDFAAAAELLRTWAERHGQGERWQRAKARQMLLAYKQDPAATWQWLTEITGARFDAQPELPGIKADVPTALDPQAVSAAAWRRRALELHPGTAEGLEWAALDALAQEELSDELLASVMPQLRHADFARASELVVRHLALRTSGGFGSIALHGVLTLAQLEECARLDPKLLGDERFVAAWLSKLAPGGLEDVERDRDVQRAHLERLETFVGRLSGAFNSLKAHVLYHRLVLDLSTGAPDRARFERYLRLPRPSPTVPPRRLEDATRLREQVVFGASFATGLPSVREDEALVRAYLEAFLVDAEDARAFEELVEPRYLARVFAETKILAGKGDMERWYSLLDDAEYYERLKQRVELRFAPTQREYYGADEPVTLEVDVKNVPTLLVKVFEVHALNWTPRRARRSTLGSTSMASSPTRSARSSTASRRCDACGVRSSFRRSAARARMSSSSSETARRAVRWFARGRSSSSSAVAPRGTSWSCSTSAESFRRRRPCMSMGGVTRPTRKAVCECRSHRRRRRRTSCSRAARARRSRASGIARKPILCAGRRWWSAKSCALASARSWSFARGSCFKASRSSSRCSKSLY